MHLSGITSVTIPEGVTSIGNYVFSGCDLTSIELPESLRSLGEGVFSYCYDLKSISIPAGVTRIESGAFNGYDGIIRVVSGSFAETYVKDYGLNYKAICQTHSWSQTYTKDKAATCMEEGVESIHCTKCGEIKRGSARSIAKTSHKYGAWIIMKAATASSTGIQKSTCTICGHNGKCPDTSFSILYFLQYYSLS